MVENPRFAASDVKFHDYFFGVKYFMNFFS